MFAAWALIGCNQLDDAATEVPPQGPSQPADSWGCADGTNCDTDLFTTNYCADVGVDNCPTKLRSLPHWELKHGCYLRVSDVADPDGRGSGRIERIISEQIVTVPRLIDDRLDPYDVLMLRQVMRTDGVVDHSEYYRNGTWVGNGGDGWGVSNQRAQQSAAFTIAAFLGNEELLTDSMLYPIDCVRRVQGTYGYTASTSCSTCTFLTYGLVGGGIGVAATLTGGAAAVVGVGFGLVGLAYDKWCGSNCQAEACLNTKFDCERFAAENYCQGMTISSLTPAEQKCQEELDKCFETFKTCLRFAGVRVPY